MQQATDETHQLETLLLRIVLEQTASRSAFNHRWCEAS